MALGLPVLQASAAIEGLRKQLAEIGLFVEQVSDPTLAAVYLRKLQSATNGDARINPYLDPHLTPLTQADAFWLFLRDAQGEIVGKHATRLDNVGHEPWGAYAARVLECIYRKENGEPSHDRWPTVAYDLSGRIVYGGDTFIHQKHQQSGIAPILFALYYLTVLTEWGAPDWLIAYIRPHQAKNWSWCKRYWTWQHDTTGFSFTARSDHRSYSLGMLDQPGFWNEIRDARDRALPLQQELRFQQTNLPNPVE